MLRKKHLERLITNYQFRLQKLKEQQALEGLSVDPKILYEIENIEAELKKLQEELDLFLREQNVIEAMQQATSNPAEATDLAAPNLLLQHQSKSEPWHILIVDDEPSWQKRLKRTLKDLNCIVVTASNYDEAEEALANPHIDLVTVDLNLDSFTEYADGLDLVHQIRDTFGFHFPIIIVTGKGNLDRQRRAFVKYNVIDFIEKGKFEPDEFKNIVLKCFATSP